MPPYSPDINPIEKFWANFKRWIKQNLPGIEDYNIKPFFFFRRNSSL
ncbi:MAG: transposase [Rickettsiaceae bacterium]|nr:transposase [Rickettsiaceae bacterium]